MAKVKVLRVQAGKIVNGRFVAKNPSCRNVPGYMDASGVFHPIRGTKKYDAERLSGPEGERARKQSRAAKKAYGPKKRPSSALTKRSKKGRK